MTDAELDTPELDSLGPVDFVIVEFPPGDANFTGEMAAELTTLVDAGTIRLIDVVILAKREDGGVEALGASDTASLRPIARLGALLAELLAADAVAELTEAMTPGTVGGLIVYENAWAGPFAAAARRAGGQLVATRRIPLQAIAASIAAATRSSDAPSE